MEEGKANIPEDKYCEHRIRAHRQSYVHLMGTDIPCLLHTVYIHAVSLLARLKLSALAGLGELKSHCQNTVLRALILMNTWTVLEY